MESEQSQNFNERLSQWVSNQGFWFQVRYSMSGSGMKGRAMFHILRMFFRILVFLLLLALVSWVYLWKRPDFESFGVEYKDNLQAALAAEELELVGLQSSQGQLEVGRLAAEGGSGTFYESFEARNIRYKMGILDGLVGRWQPGTITIARLEIDLRAGTDDADDAARLAESIFSKPLTAQVDSFEVADATLRWGYSERTQGAIESSELKMQRTDTGWRLNFKGGSFQQNWLGRLEIVELVAIIESGGILFERAEFKSLRGTVEFPGLRVAGGERPEVRGIVKIRHLALEEILPPALRTFVEGSISGDFKVSGSTNSSDGLAFEGQVVMGEQDQITLRDRFHLLKALSVVDYSRNYHRVNFNEGSFQMRTQRGGLLLSEIDLKAEELLTMQGEILVRLPTQEEIDAALAKGTVLAGSALFANEEELAGVRNLPAGESDFTLRRAAQEARRIQEGKQTMESLNLFDRLGASIEMRRLESQASERMSRMLRYEGGVRLTLESDAFERAPRLNQIYPADPVTGRIMMPVPVTGHLYELTLKQAEDIYQQGKR
jgi:hypothetical protein